MTADRAVVGSLVVYKPRTFRRSYKARIVGLVQTRAGLRVRIALVDPPAGAPAEKTVPLGHVSEVGA